jgi:hypothetical protein
VDDLVALDEASLFTPDCLTLLEQLEKVRPSVRRLNREKRRRRT